MDDFTREYKLETLDEIEESLSRLESVLESVSESNDISSYIDELFRYYHSFKGNSRSAGFEDLSQVTHLIENILLKLKENEMEYTSSVLDLLYYGQGQLIEGISFYKDHLDGTYDFTNLTNKIEDFQNSSGESRDTIETSNSKLNILIVDDEPDILDLLEFEITDFLDCTITKANNGEEAKNLCDKYYYDVIVSDFHMPKLNGLEFIKGLRYSDNDNANTPIVVITGFKPDLPVDEKVLHNVFFMEKPFKHSKIEFVLKCALNTLKKAS